jgi:hypothetical protein
MAGGMRQCLAARDGQAPKTEQQMDKVLLTLS